MPHLTVLYPRRGTRDLIHDAPFSGHDGAFFKERTLDGLPAGWTYNIVEHGTPLRDNADTTHYLALGSDWLPNIDIKEPLNKIRGYRLSLFKKPLMVTYSPADCWEFKDDADEDKEDDKTNEKDIGATRRINFLFWALRDFAKLQRPPRSPRPHYEEINWHPLLAAKWLEGLPADTYLYIDIETRRNDHILDCIGFGIIKKDGTIFSAAVAIYANMDLAWPLHMIARFWRALYNVFRREDITLVGHNLQFDICILHHYYHLPLPYKVYDTMIAMHREFPDMDKSLSHAISEYTDADRNHKGDIVINLSRKQLMTLMAYNCQDIRWTAEVHIGQRERQLASANLMNSVALANDMQVLSFIMSFTGICVDVAVKNKRIAELTKQIAALERIIRVLVDNREFNPNSTHQVSKYFHDTLGYPAAGRTPTGAPQLNEKNMYKLQISQPNPLVPLIIKYKQLVKELSGLKYVKYERCVTNA